MPEVIEETTEQKLARWQKERGERAIANLENYRFEWHAPIQKWLCSKADGSPPYVLSADATACSCPDWQFKGHKHSMPCKHLIALSVHLLMKRSRESTR